MLTPFFLLLLSLIRCQNISIPLVDGEFTPWGMLRFKGYRFYSFNNLGEQYCRIECEMKLKIQVNTLTMNLFIDDREFPYEGRYKTKLVARIKSSRILWDSSVLPKENKTWYIGAFASAGPLVDPSSTLTYRIKASNYHPPNLTTFYVILVVAIVCCVTICAVVVIVTLLVRFEQRYGYFTDYMEKQNLKKNGWDNVGEGESIINSSTEEHVAV